MGGRVVGAVQDIKSKYQSTENLFIYIYVVYTHVIIKEYIKSKHMYMNQSYDINSF